MPITTVIPYYGSKHNMLKHILKLIPEHKVYTEPFFGSGVVFFNKEPVVSEIINDKWNMVANFYQQIKLNFDKLKARIEATPFSRAVYKYVWHIYKNPQFYSKLDLAHAFYVGVTQGFNSNFNSWGFDSYGKQFKAFKNRKQKYNKRILDRLENAQLENNDAVKILESKKKLTDAFHYVDPPYIGTNMGMYSSYTADDYLRLLNALSTIKGKFLLSSFPNDILQKFIKEHGWWVLEFGKTKSAVKGVLGKPRTAKKVELLVANYPI